MLAVITCCERTIWPSASQLGTRVRRRIVHKHTTWTSQTRSTGAPSIFLIHILLCNSLTKQKEKWKKKKKEYIVWFSKGTNGEQPFCNCLATAGTACVEVQSSETHIYPSEQQKASELQSKRMPTHAHSHTHTRTQTCTIRPVSLIWPRYSVRIKSSVEGF